MWIITIDNRLLNFSGRTNSIECSNPNMYILGTLCILFALLVILGVIFSWPTSTDTTRTNMPVPSHGSFNLRIPVGDIVQHVEEIRKEEVGGIAQSIPITNDNNATTEDNNAITDDVRAARSRMPFLGRPGEPCPCSGYGVQCVDGKCVSSPNTLPLIRAADAIRMQIIETESSMITTLESLNGSGKLAISEESAQTLRDALNDRIWLLGAYKTYLNSLRSYSEAHPFSADVTSTFSVIYQDCMRRITDMTAYAKYVQSIHPGLHLYIEHGTISHPIDHSLHTGTMYYGIGKPIPFTHAFQNPPLVMVTADYQSGGTVEINGGYRLSANEFTPLVFATAPGILKEGSQYIAIGS
jgi:hypothetical protein